MAVAEQTLQFLRNAGLTEVDPEIAENQAANVAGLLNELGYEQLRISPDMAGRDRVIEAQWSR